jgi:ribosomal protein L11 methyltransferase
MSEYIGLDIKAVGADQEILLALLSDYSFDSFQEEDQKLSAYMPTSEWESEKDGVLELLKSRDLNYHLNHFEDKNWNEEWEKNFEPILVDDRVYVRADFHPTKEDIEFDLLINPQMSFGTGHHQTTFLMMQGMLELQAQGKKVLDMGCGTGILGILASKLGASEVLAADIEAWAVENSKENVARNGVNNMQVIQADIDLLNHREHFDIILANINRNVLLEHLPHYAELLNPSGDLLLSGILNEDFELLEEKCVGLGLTIVNKRSKEAWSMLHAVK